MTEIDPLFQSSLAGPDPLAAAWREIEAQAINDPWLYRAVHVHMAGHPRDFVIACLVLALAAERRRMLTDTVDLLARLPGRGWFS